MKKSSLLVLALVFSGCTQVAPEAEVKNVNVPEDGIKVEVSNADEMVEFANEDYGVKFQHPESWTLEEYNENDVFQVVVSNMTSNDGPVCKTGEGHFSVFVNNNANVGEVPLSFEDYFTANYVEDVKEVGLGQYGGKFEKTVVSGYSAYEVENIGFEAGCGSRGYVVDYSKFQPGLTVSVVMSQDKEDMSVLNQLKAMFTTFELTGYKK